MKHELTRRHLLAAPIPLGAAALLGLPSSAAAYDDVDHPYPGFPAQARPRVREMVLHAHTNLDRVKELLGESPALANAAMDWGFGDWETAIGAASHMGRRDIAAALLEAGARPDIFTHTMLGHLEAVRAAIEASPGLQKIPGPHGITMLSHAKAGGDGSKAVVAYLEKLGDADNSLESKPTPVPLSTYAGAYRHTGDARFEIAEKNGRLFFQQADDFPRALFHLGDHEFHAVARSVRLRFYVGEGAITKLEIFDHSLLVTATPA